MRKLLLASAAMAGIGGALTAPAHAQLYSPATTDPGITASALNVPSGALNVRLGGSFTAEVGVNGNSDMNGTYLYNTATGSVLGYSPTTTIPTGYSKTIGKNNSFSINDAFRIKIAVDGVAANGLQYGAFGEIRTQDFVGAGGGVYGTISGVNRARDALELRRAYGYAGTAQFGTLRIGMTDGPQILLMQGDISGFGTGGLEGAYQNSVSAAYFTNWMFQDVGSNYATNKLVYLSPQLAGFDLGIAFEPSTGGLNGDGSTPNGCEGNNYQSTFSQAAGPNTVAGQGCDQLSGTSSSDYRRRRNSIDVALRYRGTFGPVGVGAFGDFWHSSHVTNENPTVNTQSYKDINVWAGGAQLSSYGVTLGGMIRHGSINTISNGEQLEPYGGVPLTALLVGATYTVGPLVVGGHFTEGWETGTVNSSTSAASNAAYFNNQLHVLGAAAGATYTLAPGIAVFGEYIYAQQRQNNFDLQLNGGNAALGEASGIHNSIHTNYMGTGLSITW